VIIPETDLTPLDPRFPIALTGTIPLFGALLAEWEDRVTVIDQAKRAAEQARRREERFVTPAPQPRFVPADTIIDLRLHDGDRFPREGMPQPDDTDTFLALYKRAEEREQAREQRGVLRRVRRFVARLVRGT
jgi:hypothetical protein